VTVSPTVEVSPSTQVHVVGESTTVECRASGRPQPRRKSTWSARARRSSAVRRVDLNHDASPRGRRQHDGRVPCVGSTSTTTQVHVVGDSTTVECRASGRPQPRISWQLNEHELHSSHLTYSLSGKCCRYLVLFVFFVTNRPVDTKIASLQLLSHIGRTLYVDAAY